MRMTFLSLFSLLALWLTPIAARAEWHRLSANECFVTDSSFPQTVRADGQKLANYGSSSMQLHCPVPDDTRTPKQSITHVYVYGYNNTTSWPPLYVRACAGDSNSVVKSCDDWVEASGTGSQVITLTASAGKLSSWTDYASGIGWLSIHLPAAVGGTRASIRQIYYYMP